MISNASRLFYVAHIISLASSWKNKKYIKPSNIILIFKLLIHSFGVYSSELHFDELMVSPMDLSSWDYKGDHFECNLYHSKFDGGNFYFRSEVKGSVSFISVFNYDDTKWYEASLISQSAPWNRNNNRAILDSLALSQPTQRFVFHKGAEALLDSVSAGNWIALLLQGSETSDPVKLTVPTVKIGLALDAFNTCRARLPKMSYQEARNLPIYFQSGQNKLSTEQQQVIRAFYSYVSIDRRISKVLIDGHTDNQGSSLKNLTLSRVRAQQVADGLIQLGLSASKIEVRAHGERYPIASNSGSAGRYQNRRVTLRLVKNNEQTVSITETQLHQQKKAKVQK